MFLFLFEIAFQLSSFSILVMFNWAVWFFFFLFLQTSLYLWIVPMRRSPSFKFFSFH